MWMSWRAPRRENNTRRPVGNDLEGTNLCFHVVVNIKMVKCLIYTVNYCCFVCEWDIIYLLYEWSTFVVLFKCVLVAKINTVCMFLKLVLCLSICFRASADYSFTRVLKAWLKPGLSEVDRFRLQWWDICTPVSHFCLLSQKSDLWNESQPVWRCTHGHVWPIGSPLGWGQACSACNMFPICWQDDCNSMEKQKTFLSNICFQSSTLLNSIYQLHPPNTHTHTRRNVVFITIF